MDITKIVAKGRFIFNTNMVDVVNVLNQLKVIKDDKAEEMNKKYVMEIFTDILPRLGYDVESILKNKKEK